MASIVENQFFTPVSIFEVAPERQRALIDGIADEIEQHYRPAKGFVAAIFHGSKDGRRVMNYTQWVTEEDYLSFGASPGHEEIAAALRRVLKRYGARHIEVVFYRAFRIVENV